MIMYKAGQKGEIIKMKKILKGASALLLAGVVGLSWLSMANASESLKNVKIGEKIVIKDLKLDPNTYVLDFKMEDVTGDKVKDSVILVGEKQNKNDIFANKLNIVVQNGKTKKYIKTVTENLGGYKDDEMLFIGDFTGDKINDVMINAPTGGSGGIVEHVIATFKNNKPTIIFSEKENNGIKFEGKFMDNFSVKLLNEFIKKDINLDISANKNRYIESKVYDKDGKLLSAHTVYSYPFSILEPIDYDCDGTYELKGIQRIVGIANFDTISHVESVWKYDDSKWAPRQVEFTTFLMSFDSSSKK